MKAIETAYSGCLFRSRLEARWAVFFDELGLKWEYEPEGFELGDGMRYLPDFRVQYPGRCADEAHYRWFEVKGDAALITPDDWRKLDAFDLANGLILLDGAPEPRMYNKIEDFTRRNEEDGTMADWRFEAPSANRVAKLSAPRRGGWALWSSKGRLWFDDHKNFFYPNAGNEDIEAACIAARQARFEHGQRGAPSQWLQA